MQRTIKRPADRSAANPVNRKVYKDNSRVTDIYRSCHRAANQHSHNTVKVNLTVESYDVLYAAATYFSKYTELLPANVKLRLKYHDIELNSSVTTCEIQGSGMRDKNFESSIAHMHMLAKIGQSHPGPETLNVDNEMDVHEFLAYRSAVSGEKALAVSMDADGCFYGFKYGILLKLIKHQHGHEIKQALTLPKNNRPGELITRINKTIAECGLEGWSVYADEYMECETAVADHALPELLNDLRQLSLQIINNRLHEPLIERIVQHAEKHRCQSVVFMFGTNRQSFELDQFNAEKFYTGCFMRDLQEFTRDLNQRLHARMRFCLDRFLLADAYNNLESGTSFMQIYLAGHHNHLSEHSKTIFDDSKASVLYACAQRVKCMFPGITDIHIVEDIEDIASRLLRYFNSQFQKLLPHGLNFRFMMYNGDFMVSGCNEAICGSGVVDRNLYRSIQFMGCHAVADESLATAMMRPGKDFIARGSLSELIKFRDKLYEEIIQMRDRFFTGFSAVMHLPEHEGKVHRFH
jgi:hypothetical protein